MRLFGLRWPHRRMSFMQSGSREEERTGVRFRGCCVACNRRLASDRRIRMSVTQQDAERETQEAFLFIKFVTSELQEEAKRLHSSACMPTEATASAAENAQELARLKRALIYLNHAVQSALAAHAAAAGDDLALAGALRAAADRALSSAGREPPPDASQAVKQVSLVLQKQVEEEVKIALSSSMEECGADRKGLAACIRLLRACESSVVTHTR